MQALFYATQLVLREEYRYLYEESPSKLKLEMYDRYKASFLLERVEGMEEHYIKHQATVVTFKSGKPLVIHENFLDMNQMWEAYISKANSENLLKNLQ